MVHFKIFVKFWELSMILSCGRKIKGITILFNSCCVPGSDMVTRTKTSACNATTLKTENVLTLSGIIVRADREGSRRQQRGVQYLTIKYHILPYMHHNDIGIVKSRGFLLGRRSDTGFEKDVKNVSLLVLWLLCRQARLEMKVLKCSVKPLSDLLNCKDSGNIIWLGKNFA